MTPLRRQAFVPAVGALMLAVVTTGCSPGEAPEPSPEPTVATSSPPPSGATSMPASSMPQPSPSATWDEEQTAAAEVVLTYFTLVNDLSKNPELDVDALSDITTGRTKKLDVAMINDDREAGISQTGDNRYYVQDVAPIQGGEGAKTTIVKACTDSTETDLIDENGASVLDESRAFFVEWTLEVVIEDDRWKVGDITNERVLACGA